jgi:monomeric isocitrate dehydrogenase
MAKFDFNPDRSWLEALEPLDNVYLFPSYWGLPSSDNEETITVAKISRITKTLIVLTEGSRFRRTDGAHVGNLARKKPARIFPYSAENRQSLGEYRLRKDSIQAIESFNLYKLPTDKLIAIVELLKTSQ